MTTTLEKIVEELRRQVDEGSLGWFDYDDGDVEAVIDGAIDLPALAEAVDS